MNKGQHYAGLSVSESEAKGTVEEKLRKQQLTKPLTEEEMTAFCDRMSRYFDFDFNTDGPTRIRGWANDWQAQWFERRRERAIAFTPLRARGSKLQWL